MELIVAWLFFAVVGAIIGSARSGRGGLGFALGLLLGPIGWLISAIMGRSEKDCPRCGERVSARAKICRHCHHDLTGVSSLASLGTAQTGRLVRRTVPVVAKPSIGTQTPIGRLDEGSRAAVVGTQGIFSRVRVGAVEGWVPTDALEPGSVERPSPAPAPAAQATEPQRWGKLPGD